MDRRKNLPTLFAETIGKKCSVLLRLFSGGVVCFFALCMPLPKVGQAREFDQLVLVHPGIACHYYDPTAKDFGQDWALEDLRQRSRYYARTPVGFHINGKSFSNDEILVQGKKSDRFYIVKKLRLWSLLHGYTKFSEKPTRHMLEKFCRGTIKSHRRSYELYDMAVSRTFDTHSLPIVFLKREQAQNAAGYISRMVVFGDSLSDTGKMRGKLGSVGFLNAPYWLGRFSNGPNWVDYLSRRLNVVVANWAVGGAVAAEVNDAKIHQITSYLELGGQHFVSGSVQDQIKEYLDNHVKIVKGKKTLAEPEKTLYVIWVGANDYGSKIENEDTLNIFVDTPNQKGGHRRTARRTVRAIEKQFRELYAAGARNFLIINLPNMGKTPTVSKNGENYRKSSAKSKNERIVKTAEAFAMATARHNELLHKVFDTGRLTDKSLRLAYLNMESVMQDLENETHLGSKFHHGFTLSKSEIAFGNTRATFGKACYSGGYLGDEKKPQKKVCDHALSALYWDDVHPTTLAHCWLSYFAQKELAKQQLAPDAGSIEEHKAFCKEANPHAMPPRSSF